MKTKISVYALLFFTLALPTSATASGHTGYVECAWWQTICETYNRYNTKYPIVLVHGVSGFDSLLGLVDYFHNIPENLEGNLITGGRAKVYVPNITAWDDAYVRGEQLLEYIETHVLPDSGASKVNLIGHSLGGPTIRYVASVSPELVASVTTVNAVNFGSGFADWGLDNFPEGSTGNDIIADLLDALGNITDALAGNPGYEQDALSAALFLTTDGANTFNSIHSAGMPDSYCGEGPAVVDDVRYFSWGGTGTWTNLLDVSDVFLSLTGSLGYFNGEANDGLVSRCSMHWGDVLRDDYNTNHLDATNLLFGLTGWHDPVDIYENHAARLRDMGL
ncbi:MAG: lipase [Proteobacteria bacterium]|nr:MAG: lipase [Pseudomonadota bacterium]